MRNHLLIAVLFLFCSSGLVAQPKNSTNWSDIPWADDTVQLHIPVVVHVIYDYNTAPNTVVNDTSIYAMIDRLNLYYNKANPDLSGIIPVWQPWTGNGHVTFQLARLDPNNKPTRGIVRTQSFLTWGGGVSAKIDQWPPDQYLNIYFVNDVKNSTPGVVLGYATSPGDYVNNPYSEGIMCRYDQALSKDQSFLASQAGIYLGLIRNAGPLCMDDSIDDTPPIGSKLSCLTNLYDLTCAAPYFKSYDSANYYKRTGIKKNGGGIIDYPDTVNTQNIMENASCANAMFTIGQVARLRSVLRSPVGMRNNLIDTQNLIRTGIMDATGHLAPKPDITPMALFSVSRPIVCADGTSLLRFDNRSYNDTIATALWSFSNGATNSDSINLNSAKSAFTVPGWVNVSLTVEGNNTGSSTITRNDMVYAVDPTPVNPVGYYQDFNPGGDLHRYPIFNYFKTDHRWELFNNAGVYDQTSICYKNYDKRIFVSNSNAIETPGGDYADFFTPLFDISSYTGLCNLSFYSAGAFRTNSPSQLNDSLFISASANCGESWTNLAALSGTQIGNNQPQEEPFVPVQNQWKEQSIPVSGNLRTSSTMFRFRFKAGTNTSPYSGYSFGTGNNFYIDRFRISDAPLSVKHGVITELDMTVKPNPTKGLAVVELNGGDNSVAEISVLDVTGKVVYSTKVTRATAKTSIEIPAEKIAAKGIYLVKVITNGATEMRKLSVY